MYLLDMFHWVSLISLELAVFFFKLVFPLVFAILFVAAIVLICRFNHWKSSCLLIKSCASGCPYDPSGFWLQSEFNRQCPRGPEHSSKSHFNSQKPKAMGNVSLLNILAEQIHVQSGLLWLSGTHTELTEGRKTYSSNYFMCLFHQTSVLSWFLGQKAWYHFSVSNILPLPLTHNKVPSFQLSLLNVSWTHPLLSASTATSFIQAPVVLSLKHSSNSHVFLSASFSHAETWLDSQKCLPKMLI